MRRLADIAEQEESRTGFVVNLLIENCAGLGGSSGDNAVRLIEEVGSPNVFSLFDPGNPVWHYDYPLTGNYPSHHDYYNGEKNLVGEKILHKIDAPARYFSQERTNTRR